MSAMLLALLLATTASPAVDPPAQSSAGTDVVAIVQMPQTIRSGAEVVDPMFGQRVRALGLERSVRMWQWQRRADGKGGYEAVWSDRSLRNEGADAAHTNPMRFPIDGARWWSPDARLEQHPVAAQVLTAVATQADAKSMWIPVKPDMARVPANLAATFQADGDGLTTSQDPAHRQIGDMQVQWRALVAAPAPSGLRLVDGRWQLPRSAPVTAVAASSTAARSTAPPPVGRRTWAGNLSTGGIVLLVLLGLALVALGLTMRGRR
ncbi:MAG: hypothetical protein JSS03_06210 [Proteobacteria bacterium]|nr:hypothetical protein [Pseudomonadota bacterium]